LSPSKGLGSRGPRGDCIKEGRKGRGNVIQEKQNKTKNPEKPKRRSGDGK
jgi:hypothetical protein